jgi:hypothetical protein
MATAVHVDLRLFLTMLDVPWVRWQMKCRSIEAGGHDRFGRWVRRR